MIDEQFVVDAARPISGAPFELLSVSWPRPVQCDRDTWLSEPVWDAPRAPDAPVPRWRVHEGEGLLGIDWCDWCRSGMFQADAGEMRGFHVVFRVRLKRSGRLEYWDDDGSIVRRRGVVLHEDRRAHGLERHEVDVEAGDELDVAQWQHSGQWYWGARFARPSGSPDVRAAFREPLHRVLARLSRPDGPALKMFTHGREPARTVLAVYALVLNGFVPEQVLLYGEHQWAQSTRELFGELLPFASVVTTDRVLHDIAARGGHRLAMAASRHWFVMKALVSILHPPNEFCALDDDVIVLEPLDDALEAFRDDNLVFSPERDFGAAYASCWRHISRTARELPTGRLNAGLYFMRNRHDAGDIARWALGARIDPGRAHVWEQGLLAALGARDGRWRQLPSARYLFPAIDGLLGTPFGYDFARNPCGYAAIHFTGEAGSWKPDGAFCVERAHAILDRRERVVTGPVLSAALREPNSFRRSSADAGRFLDVIWSRGARDNVLETAFIDDVLLSQVDVPVRTTVVEPNGKVPLHDDMLLVSFGTEFAKTLQTARARGCRNLGVFHLADEFGSHDRAWYPWADYVLRHYWFDDALASPGPKSLGVAWVPNGYRTGVGPLAPDSLPSAAERRIMGFFAGAIQGRALSHERLRMTEVVASAKLPFLVVETHGFAGGFDPDTYVSRLKQSRFALVPGGNSPETIRLYDALEAGSIPIMLKSAFVHAKSGLDTPPFILLDDWTELPTAYAAYAGSTSDTVAEIEARRQSVASWWAAFKIRQQRIVARVVKESFARVRGGGATRVPSGRQQGAKRSVWFAIASRGTR